MHSLIGANQMKPENFFALDLELNNLKNGKVPKIIQVGVAIGNPLCNDDDIQTYSWYLNPEEEINEEITKLTGITNEMVQTQSVPHQVVAEELGSLIKTYKCFTNPVVWGQGDADELKNEFRERGIDFPFFGRRIFDVKTLFVFNQIVNGRTKSGGLRKVINSYNLGFKGTPHRADDDALNTLRLFFFYLRKERALQDYLNTYNV